MRGSLRGLSSFGLLIVLALAVAAVPHPAGDAEARGFLAHRVAESHALDTAGDHQVFRHPLIF